MEGGGILINVHKNQRIGRNERNLLHQQRGIELHTPTNARVMPTYFMNAGAASRLRTLLKQSKARLLHTEQPNALPASWRCPG